MENLFRGKSGRSLFVLLCLAAYLIGISPHLIHWFTAGSPPDALVWNLTHYHVSYPEYGFLRRGLLGTAMAPLLAPLTDGGGAEYAVMLGLDLGLMLVLIWLAMRFFLSEDGVPGQGWILAALILSPVGFVQLGYDAGRLDHVNFVLAAIAVLCALRGWSIAAGALGRDRGRPECHPARGGRAGGLGLDPRPAGARARLPPRPLPDRRLFRGCPAVPALDPLPAGAHAARPAVPRPLRGAGAVCAWCRLRALVAACLLRRAPGDRRWSAAWPGAGDGPRPAARARGDPALAAAARADRDRGALPVHPLGRLSGINRPI